MSPRHWPALDVRSSSPGGEATQEIEDAILLALDEVPVSAVQELPSGWRFFFASADAREGAVRILQREWRGTLRVVPVDVSDEDWAARSQEGLAPIRVGRIIIAPPWAAAAPADPSSTSSSPDAAISVIIQPSMGFGTGHHATTRLCTALMQEAPLAGRTVLDVGTGSGVLALIAARLGAQRVLAIDDDPDALESARENLSLNGVTGGIELRQADFRAPLGARFDAVTANLTGALLVRGASNLLDVLAGRAVLILSGVTAEEEPAVRAAFDPHLALRSRLQEDEWVGLMYERM